MIYLYYYIIIYNRSRNFIKSFIMRLTSTNVHENVHEKLKAFMIHRGQWLVKVKIAMPCREKFIFFPNNLFPSDPMYKGVLMHFVHAHKKQNTGW